MYLKCKTHGKNVGKSDTTFGENTEDSNNDNVKHIIQTEIQGILKGYKDQLKKVTSTVEMLQQHVSNLKCENSVLQDKVKVYCQEFDSRCDESEQYGRRICLRVKNIKKSDNETSEVVLESIRNYLMRQMWSYQMDVLIEPTV